MKLRNTRKAKTAATDLFKKVLISDKSKSPHKSPAASPRKEGSQSPRSRRNDSPARSSGSGGSSSKSSTSGTSKVKASRSAPVAKRNSPFSERSSCKSDQKYSKKLNESDSLEFSIKTEPIDENYESNVTGDPSGADEMEIPTDDIKEEDFDTGYEEKNETLHKSQPKKEKSKQKSTRSSNKQEASPTEKFTAIMTQLSKPVQIPNVPPIEKQSPSNVKKVSVRLEKLMMPADKLADMKSVKCHFKSTVDRNLNLDPTGKLTDVDKLTEAVRPSSLELSTSAAIQEQRQENDGNTDVDIPSPQSDNVLVECNDEKCHPTDHFSPKKYFSNLGLIKKSELPDSSAKGHRLHRAAGGKLRRVLKPKCYPDMMSQSMQKAIALGVVFESDSDSDGRASPHFGLGHRSRALNKLLEQSGNRSPRAGSANSSPSSTPRKILDPRKSLLASDTHNSKRKKQWLLPPSKKKMPPHSNILQKMLEAAPKKMIDVPDPNQRRSARNKDKRKEWWHLLRANPDEFEKPNQPGEIPVPQQKRRKKEEITKSKNAKDKKLQGKADMTNSKKGTNNSKSAKVSSGGGTKSSCNEKSNQKKKKLNDSQQAPTPCKKSADIPKDILEKASQLLPGLRPELASEILAQTMEVTGPDLLDLDDEEILQKVTNSPIRSPHSPAPSPVKKQPVFKSPHPLPPKSVRPRINLSSHLTIKEEPFDFELEDDSLPIISGLPEDEEESRIACLFPHMCESCWVNDHNYYAKEKKRSKDMSIGGGCLHYVPCVHYRMIKDTVKEDCRVKGLYGQSYILRYTSNPDVSFETRPSTTHLTIAGNKLKKSPVKTPVPTCFDDLLCKENMPPSDGAEIRKTFPSGTELLHAQLQARTLQLENNAALDPIISALLSADEKEPEKEPEVIELNDVTEESEDAPGPVHITEFGAEEIFGMFDSEPEIPLMGLKCDKDPRFVYHRDSLGRPRRRMPNTSKKTWDHATMDMLTRQREMSELAASVLSEKGKVRLAELQEETHDVDNLQKDLAKARMYPPKETSKISILKKPHYQYFDPRKLTSVIKVPISKSGLSGSKTGGPHTSRLKIRIVPASAAESNPDLLNNSTKDPNKTQRVVKVKIQRIDPGKVVISKVKDDDLDTASEESSCTVTHSPLKSGSSPNKAHPNRVHIQGELFKNSDKILEQVIAREAARFVNQPDKDTQVVTVTLECERIDAGDSEGGAKKLDSSSSEIEVDPEEIACDAPANLEDPEQTEKMKLSDKEETHGVDIDEVLDIPDSQESGYASFHGSQELSEPLSENTLDTTNTSQELEVTNSDKNCDSKEEIDENIKGAASLSTIIENEFKSDVSSVKDKWSVVGMITSKGLQPVKSDSLPITNSSHLAAETLSVKSGERKSVTVTLGLEDLQSESEEINVSSRGTTSTTVSMTTEQSLNELQPVLSPASKASSVSEQSVSESQPNLSITDSVASSKNSPLLSRINQLIEQSAALVKASSDSSITSPKLSTSVLPSVFPPIATSTSILLPGSIKRGHYKVSSLDSLTGHITSFDSKTSNSIQNSEMETRANISNLPTESQSIPLLSEVNMEPSSLTELAQRASLSPSVTEANLLNQIESKVNTAKLEFSEESVEQQLADISDIIATEVPEQAGMMEGSKTGDFDAASVNETESKINVVDPKLNVVTPSLPSSAVSLLSTKWSSSSIPVPVTLYSKVITDSNSGSCTLNPVLATSQPNLQTVIIPSSSLEPESAPFITQVSSTVASIIKSSIPPEKPAYTVAALSTQQQPISMSSAQSVLPKELQEQSTSLDDGSQVLTFTTKEIRQKNPKLLNYMKNAGLVPVVKAKLETEKMSILSLMAQAELQMSTFRSTKLSQESHIEALSTKRKTIDQEISTVHQEIVTSDSMIEDYKRELLHLEYQKQNLNTRIRTCVSTLQKLKDFEKKS